MMWCVGVLNSFNINKNNPFIYLCNIMYKIMCIYMQGLFCRVILTTVRHSLGCINSPKLKYKFIRIALLFMMCSQLQRCKPAVMALTGILLLVTALRLLSLTAGKPANARASGPGAPARTYQCSSFSNAICNSLDGKGYNHAAFPNPLSSIYLPTVQTAQDQASIYIPLAVASGCSSRVAKFLCFSFFPLCVEATPSIPPVFPCPSFCRKVKADCEPYLMARYATSWPQWLDCDDMERVLRDSQSLCVNETEAAATTALPTMTTSTPVQLKATTRLPPISGSSNPTTPPPLSTAAPVCEVCNPRTNVTSGTFRVAVNNYTFGKFYNKIHN